jgi:asparagine synthase (glutamine-hydrolysing)/putative beta-lactam synthetase
MSMSVGLEIRLPFCDHRLVEYVWNVPWSMKSTGGLKGLLKAAMADALPPSTTGREKSAYPHVRNPEYEWALLREATSIVTDRSSPVAGMFDAPRLTALIDQVRAGKLRSMLPGGSSGAQLFIQLIEMRNWINDYQVSLR